MLHNNTISRKHCISLPAAVTQRLWHSDGPCAVRYWCITIKKLKLMHMSGSLLLYRRMNAHAPSLMLRFECSYTGFGTQSSASLLHSFVCTCMAETMGEFRVANMCDISSWLLQIRCHHTAGFVGSQTAHSDHILKCVVG